MHFHRRDVTARDDPLSCGVPSAWTLSLMSLASIKLDFQFR